MEYDIYTQLRTYGMSHNGACALMGNMACESAMKANNAQDGMTQLTDSQYTMLFNSTPEQCYSDGVGYGLCQWTYPTRKRNLRQFAYAMDVSVGDERMQTAFAVKELQADYPTLWQYLCRDVSDLYNATDRICREFERPAKNNVQERFEAAQVFDVRFKGVYAPEEETPEPDAAETAEQLIAEIESKLDRLRELLK